MYTNCRASSLLDWKIITDQEAENYLVQSFLRKTEWKEMRNNGHELSHGRPNRMETSHTTKATQYMEEGKTDNPEEEVLEEHEKHNKATDKMQYGETSRKEPYKETGSDKTREQDSIQEEEVTNTELSWLKAKMNFENYRNRTSKLEADLSREDFATRITNQAELRKIMDTKLRQLEYEKVRRKQHNN